MSNAIVWPRQEVLQLITPQLVTTRKNVFAVIKQLSKHQTIDGKIRLIILIYLFIYVLLNYELFNIL
jgi:hypothetical protein